MACALLSRMVLTGLALLSIACSNSDGNEPPCSAPNERAGAEKCADPAPAPRGAKQERSGRLTVLEAPMPAPFTTLDEQWPSQKPTRRVPRLVHPSVPPALRPFIRALPQAEKPSGAVLDLGSQHVIVLRDGCFFLDRDGKDDPLVHFPRHVGLTVDDEGYLAFRSRYEGQQDIVRVGLPAETGWFSEPYAAPADIAEQCRARTMVGVTTVSNPYAQPARFLAGLRRFRDRERLDDAQAAARANRCLQDQAGIAADRRLGRSTERMPDCRMLWGY